MSYPSDTRRSHIASEEPSCAGPGDGRGVGAEIVPRVAVVLCTWRAGPYLEAQLDSLAAQSWPHDVHVFDDASGDASTARSRAHGTVVRVVERKRNLGFVGNFAAGLADVLERGYDYVAFADQDDVWHARRLADGMHALLAAERRSGSSRPLLAHSDLRVMDAEGATLHPSFLAWRGYASGDARDLPTMLGQCGVMGNTVLVNRALGELALPFPTSLFVHDWWLGVLAEIWGERLFVPRATVDYRLHANNASNPLASTRRDPATRLARLGLRGLLARDFRLPFKEDARVEVLESLLAGDAHRPALDDESRRTIERFVDYLRLARPRPLLLASMLRGGFVRRGKLHRARFAIALLLSRRYAASDAPTATSRG